MAVYKRQERGGCPGKNLKEQRIHHSQRILLGSQTEFKDFGYQEICKESRGKRGREEWSSGQVIEGSSVPVGVQESRIRVSERTSADSADCVVPDRTTADDADSGTG